MTDAGRITETTGPGHVVVVRTRNTSAHGHEAVTLDTMARRIATLMGSVYAGDYAPAAHYDGPLYFVPDETLLDADAARLGIRTQDDLFGGVVPYPFVATKSVSHPALERTSRVPEGWSHALAERLADAVLPGFSVFTAADARHACERILKTGAARMKPALGIGGTGQTVANCLADFDAALQQIDEAELRKYGLAIEQNLDDVVTYSVGQAELAGIRISYYGMQRLTRNHRDQDVYGGSDLHVVRGDFDALLARELPADIRHALEQARRYDECVREAFPGFFASRRNYDVVRGRDRDGREVSGVLEQSWRIGGASPAEIAAVEALLADPALHAVQASTHEIYALQSPPPGAAVHFSGDDERVGHITKYSVVGDGNQA